LDTNRQVRGQRTRRIRSNSQNQERAIAESFKEIGFKNSRRQPGSGAFNMILGDVDPGELLLAEAKQTRSGQLTIKHDWIVKIEAQAKQMNRPWWALHTWVAKGESNFRKSVVISEEFFFYILKRMKDAEAELEK